MLSMLRAGRQLAQRSWSTSWLSRGSKTGAKLSVVLTKDVENLGTVGDRLQVNQGYARNLLFPRRLAAYDPDARLGGRKKKSAAQDQGEDSLNDRPNESLRQQRELEQVINKLLDGHIAVRRRKKRGHIIEGQVTAASISDAIAKQKRIDIVRDLIELEAPIIQHGTFLVPLAISIDGKKAALSVVVQP